MDKDIFNIVQSDIGDTLKNCDSDEEKSFIRRGIRNVLQDLLAAINQNETGVMKAFQTIKIEFTWRKAQFYSKEATELLLTDPTELAPVGTIVEQMAEKAATGAMEKHVSTVSSSLSSSGSGSSSLGSGESCLNQAERVAVDTQPSHGPQASFGAFYTSTAESFQEIFSGNPETAVVDEKECVTILNVIRVTNYNFHSAVDHRTYRIADKSRRCTANSWPEPANALRG